MCYNIGIITNEEGKLFKWQIESINRITIDNKITFFKPIVINLSDKIKRKQNSLEKLNHYLLEKSTSFHSTHNVNKDKLKELVFEKRGGKFYLQKGQEEKIEEFDLLLRFGLNILSGKILSIPKIGVLSFHHGCMEKFKGGPAGFWEILEGKHLTISTQILNEKLDAGIRIYQASFANRMSFRYNREVLYKMSPIILEKSIKILQNKELSKLKSLRVSKESVYKHPKFHHIIKYFWLTSRTKLKRKFQKINLFSLHMKLIDVNAEDITLSGGIPLFNDERNHILRADPFIVEANDNSITLVYEYLNPIKSKLGHIRKLEFDYKQKLVLKDHILIQKPYHLSFPFVFNLEEKGNIILPEQRNKPREKYKYEYFDPITGHNKGYFQFPYTDLVDIVLFRYQKTIYAFGTQVIDNDVSDGVLRLFTFEKKSHIAKEHPSSPISVGQESSRMAGRIISKDGKLYRIFQNNLKGYGDSIGLSEILKLSQDDYKEIILQRSIKPKNTKASHHLDRFNNIISYDRS